VTPARAAVLDRVAASLLARPPVGTVRVGIDGVDGAGKTMFADELRARLIPSGRPVIRATVDGFHNPKSVRYRRGRSSPEGFYRDSYDYATLQRVLLDPLGPGGTGRFRPAVFDVDADVAVDTPDEQALPGSILLLDGIFLHREIGPSRGTTVTTRARISTFANASPGSTRVSSSTTMIWPLRSSYPPGRHANRGGRTWLSTVAPCRSSAGTSFSPTAASRPP
jgi:hypothetical protein